MEVVGEIALNATVVELENKTAINFPVVHNYEYKKDGKTFVKERWVSCSIYRTSGVKEIQKQLRQGKKIFVSGIPKTMAYVNTNEWNLIIEDEKPITEVSPSEIKLNAVQCLDIKEFQIIE